MSSRHDLEKELDGVLATILDLQRQHPSSWPTWGQVAKRACGTQEEATRLSAIAELPEYRSYFICDGRGNRVKLSEEGLIRAQQGSQALSPSANSPAAVAAAVTATGGLW